MKGTVISILLHFSYIMLYFIQILCFIFFSEGIPKLPSSTGNLYLLVDPDLSPEGTPLIRKIQNPGQTLYSHTDYLYPPIINLPSSDSVPTLCSLAFATCYNSVNAEKTNIHSLVLPVTKISRFICVRD